VVSSQYGTSESSESESESESSESEGISTSYSSVSSQSWAGVVEEGAAVEGLVGEPVHQPWSKDRQVAAAETSKKR
jgi:hypothetical protein